jgi:hypothetical protein
MPATTTQRTEAQERQEWRAYLLACVAEHRTHAAMCEAAAHRAALQIGATDAKRAEETAYWKAAAEKARADASSAVERAAEYEDACICSPPGMLADAPCPRCTPALLGAMGHSVHAEVSDGR